MSLELLNIKQPYEVSFTGNPIQYVFAITPYGDHEKNQITQLQVNVYIEQVSNSGNYLRVKSQVFYPSTEGLIEFDLRAYIEPYVSYTKIQPTLTNPINCESHSCRFKISYQLIQNGTVVTDLKESDVKMAVKGGLPYEQWHPSEFFSEVISTQKMALNYETDGEYVGKDDTRFLYWVYPFNDFLEQTVVVVVNMADGTFNNHVYTTSLTTKKWGVCCMPVGYFRMNLYSLRIGAKDIVSYTFAVINADDITIVSKTYYLDYRTFYRSEQLLYRNSVGAIETLRLRGQIDYEADYTRQNAIRITVPSYFTDGILNNQNSNYFNEETEKKVGDTGFLSKAAQQKVRSLFLAEEVYELVGDKLLPVSVNSANAKFYSNWNTLISIQVEWKKAYSNQFYFPLGVMPTVRTCPALLSFVVRQINRTTLRIMWSMPMPYDAIQIIIQIPNGSGGVTEFTYTYQGNSGIKNQYFANTNTSTTETIDIIVKARVICNRFSTPMDMGSQSTITVAAIGPSLPIARDDYFLITPGDGSSVTLPISVLANDEDPDGDEIEVVDNAGSCYGYGTYSIDNAGIVIFTPPHSYWIGQSYILYTVRKVANHSLTNIGVIKITSANGTVNIYAKIVTEGTGYEAITYIKYYSNNAGTEPIDVTGFGVTISYRKDEISNDPEGVNSWSLSTDYTIIPNGTQTNIYTGTLAIDIWSVSFVINPGRGYTVI